MRLRNSSGKESSTSSAILEKRSRVIVHPQRSLRIAVVTVSIIVIVNVVIFPVVLFVFVLVWLLSNDKVGSSRPIRKIAALPRYRAHVPWYAAPWQNLRALYQSTIALVGLDQRPARRYPDGMVRLPALLRRKTADLVHDCGAL